MTAGKKYVFFFEKINYKNNRMTYLWRDENKDEKPQEVSAKEYISRSFDWIKHLLDDEKVFPSSPSMFFLGE